MRGEYQHIIFNFHLSTGSPPHAWGILSHLLSRFASCRFTPTCMGNTVALVELRRVVAVHPHMRGEYQHIIFNFHLSTGSPPHAWGILIPRQLEKNWGRFTPTCVGNTCPLCRSLSGYRFTPTCVGNTLGGGNRLERVAVHPHMRGEYVLQIKPPSSPKGSPPHAWGIHVP